MSNKALNEIWKLRGLSPCAKIVLIKIADMANGEKVCWPSTSKIAEDCGVDQRTVRRTLEFAIKNDVLRCEYRPGKSTIYHMSPRAPRPDGHGVRPDTTPPTQGTTPYPPRTLATSHLYEPIIEPIKNQNAFEASVNFEYFWKAYPKKTRKRFALAAYQSALTRISHDDLMAALQSYQFPDAEKFCQKPEDWLEGDCWHDQKTNGAIHDESDDPRWEMRVKYWLQDRSSWIKLQWGEPPDSIHCRCPKPVLENLGVACQTS